MIVCPVSSSSILFQALSRSPWKCMYSVKYFARRFFPQQVCNTKTGGEGLKATWTIIIAATIMSDCRMRLDDITVHGSVHSGKLTECG